MYLCFAPMDGITTCATRLITQQIFQKYGNQNDTLNLRTEFMNVDGFLINPHQVIKHLLTTPGQKPVAQIYGGNKDTLIKATEKIQNEYSQIFGGIELNTGCPSNTVMKVGGGSDMLRDKERTLNIIKELSTIQGPLPFSIKTRAGLNESDKLEQMNFLIKASEYCSKISVHGRTLKQGYTGNSDRDFISELKKKFSNPLCKIIGNGGIYSYSDAKEKNQTYNLDGIMIGQSAIGNPWIFTTHIPTNKDKYETIVQHLDYSIACDLRFDERISNKSGNISVSDLEIPVEWMNNEIKKIQNKPDIQPHRIVEFRKFLFQYVKGIPGSKERKQETLSYKTYGEIKFQLAKLFIN